MKLEQKIDDQSQHLDKLKSINVLFLDLVDVLKKKPIDRQLLNNLQSSEIPNSTPNPSVNNTKDTSQEFKSFNELEDFNVNNMFKGGLTVFFLLLILITFYTIIIHIYNSGISLDDSFIQLKNLLKIPQDNVSHLLEEPAKDILNENSDNKRNKVESINNNSINNKNLNNINSINNDNNLNEIEKIRSLYVIKNNIDYNRINEVDQKIEFIRDNTPSQDSALKNYLTLFVAISFLFISKRFVEGGINNLLQLPNLFNNIPNIGIDAEIPPLSERVKAFERSLNPTLISELLDKSKEILVGGIDYLEQLGGNPAISAITANAIGILFSLLDELKEPLEKPNSHYDEEKIYRDLEHFNSSEFRTKDFLNYESEFDKNPDTEDIDDVD